MAVRTYYWMKEQDVYLAASRDIMTGTIAG